MLQNHRLGIKSVWVYSPKPLESISEGPHLQLRSQVCDNMINGVHYTYFTSSKVGTKRIIDLADRMHDEASHLLDVNDKIDIRKTLKNNLRIVELSPLHFLSHFTIHHLKNGEVMVYQSIVRSDRNDKIEKLDGVQGEKIRELIADHLESLEPRTESGILILS